MNYEEIIAAIPRQTSGCTREILRLCRDVIHAYPSDPHAAALAGSLAAACDRRWAGMGDVDMIHDMLHRYGYDPPIPAVVQMVAEPGA